MVVQKYSDYSPHHVPKLSLFCNSFSGLVPCLQEAERLRRDPVSPIRKIPIFNYLYIHYLHHKCIYGYENIGGPISLYGQSPKVGLYSGFQALENTPLATFSPTINYAGKKRRHCAIPPGWRRKLPKTNIIYPESGIWLIQIKF